MLQFHRISSAKELNINNWKQLTIFFPNQTGNQLLIVYKLKNYIKFSDMSESEIKLKQAKQIEKQFMIPSRQLKTLVDYLKVTASDKSSFFLPCGGCLRNYAPVDPAFHRAFKFFTREEKITYFHKIMTILRECLKTDHQMVRTGEKQNVKSMSLYFFSDEENCWQRRKIQINFTSKLMRFENGKDQINFRYYILRNSKKKDRKSLALESTDSLQLPTTIRLSNHKETFEELKDMLEQLIFDATKQKFIDILSKCSVNLNRKRQDPDRLLQSQTHMLKLSKTQTVIQSPQPLKKVLNANLMEPIPPPKIVEQNIQEIDLSPKLVPPKVTIADHILSDSERYKLNLINSLSKSQNFVQKERGVFVNTRENKVRKIYSVSQEQFNFSLDWFSDNLWSSTCFKRWKPTIQSSKTIKLPNYNNKTDQKIFQQIHQYRQKKSEVYIYKREKYAVRSDALYFFDKSYQDPVLNLKSPNKIEYVIWKFQKGNNKLTICAQAKINHTQAQGDSHNLTLTSQFLGEISKLCDSPNITLLDDSNFKLNTMEFQQHCLSQINMNDPFQEDQDFFTIHSNKQLNQSSVIIIEQIEAEQFQTKAKFPLRTNPTKEIKSEKDQKFLNKQVQQKVYLKIEPQYISLRSLNSPFANNRLKWKHPTGPFPKAAPKLTYPKTMGLCPFWQNQFKFNDKGEMISINLKKLQAQKGVLSSLVKTIGKNIFSGKSILNISLPVTVFSYQSNLSLLCKSYVYAPLHLERAAKALDPIERMKYIVAFAMGTTTAYIQMDKPFNPILGQTFHTLIDGCPVYGEQISHHPPISSCLMKGRGYTIYGSFQAKVSLSINSAKGSNEGICHISFDEKDLTKKIVKYNYQPGQISGLTWGQRTIRAVDKSCYLDVDNMLYLQLQFGKHKGETEYCKYDNGIEGKLVKLDKNTDISKFPIIKNKKIVEEYGIFNGKWTQLLYYEDDLIFNSWKQYPSAPEKYPCPLESDAFYRKDLLLRIAQNMEDAQTAKEELENIQRNDRKLRKKYTGVQH